MSHFYTPSGEARYFIPKKSGGGTRPTTVRDARELGLYPSPSTILDILDKPALLEWKIRNAVAAIMTAPDAVPNEAIDAKITRVLDVEKQHEEESNIAKDRGTEIHDAIQEALENAGQPEYMRGQSWNPAMNPFILPVVDAVMKTGRVVATEKIVVNNEYGYAGRTDTLTEGDEWLNVWDFKSCKTIPKRDAYPEARMQVSAYAKALGNTGNKHIRCFVCYISKTNPGEIGVFEVLDWQHEFERFKLLLHFYYLTHGLKLPMKFEAPLPF